MHEDRKLLFQRTANQNVFNTALKSMTENEEDAYVILLNFKNTGWDLWVICWDPPDGTKSKV